MVEKVQWLTEKFYREGYIEFYESAAKNTVQNAIQMFIEQQVIKLERSNSETLIKLCSAYQDASELKQFTQKIGLFE